MNNTQNTTQKDIWAMPTGEPDLTLKNRTAEDVALWRKLVSRVIEIAKAGEMTKAEVL